MKPTFKTYLQRELPAGGKADKFTELLHHIAEEELLACKVLKLQRKGAGIYDILADCQDRPRVEGYQPDLTKRLRRRLKLHPLQGFNELKVRVLHVNADRFTLDGA